MNFKSIFLLLMLGLCSRVSLAGDNGLQARINEVNEKIKMEQEANQKLKDDIAARDNEIANLKQKLKELETQTSSSGNH